MSISPATCFAYRGFIPAPLLAAQLFYMQSGIEHAWAYAVFVSAGEILRLWAAGVIGRQSRTLDATVGVLATAGPYAFVRNPLYIANTIQWVGLGCAVGLGWAAAWLVMAVVLYARIVPWEEEQLKARWPAEFQRWSSEVRAWWPSWRSSSHSSAAFSFGRALRSERSTIVVWLGVTLLLVLR